MCIGNVSPSYSLSVCVFMCVHIALIMIVSSHVTFHDIIAHLPGDWVKLDDDKVSVLTEEQILKLSGGGDWHVAYILLYAPRRLERLREEEGGGRGQQVRMLLRLLSPRKETFNATNKQ